MKVVALVFAAVSLVLAAALPDSAKSTRKAHEVTSLPGIEHKDIAFAHFAGQLELEETHEQLFYWYTESQSDPAHDPIVLWLNGGPGCSSINGFFTENGPFVVQSDLSVKLNPYAWNRKANVVWLDSPAGVGFSGPLQDATYYNDDVVASRLHAFVERFFATYPELQHRKFYITGESYAGMYIPYLVDLLVQQPLDGVNLAGFAIGNPLTDNTIDGNAYLDYYLSHALISRSAYRHAVEQCSSNVAQCMFTPVDCTEACRTGIDAAFAAADTTHFNHYYIYGDVCHRSSSSSNGGQAGALHANSSHHGVSDVATHRGAIGPCTEEFTAAYLNLREVQEAVHVAGAPVAWVDCQPFISRHFTRSLSSLPKYRSILHHGLDALIYSGDADSVVNFIGTERWIGEDGLDLKEIGPWRSWLGPDHQIAGYVQEFEGLTFKTVKGAGHMVPAVKPLHGLYLFECFVYGDDACATFKYPSDAFEHETGDAADSDDSTDSDDVATQQQLQLAIAIAATARDSVVVAPHASSPVVLIGGSALVVLCGVVLMRQRRREREMRREERIPFASTL